MEQTNSSKSAREVFNISRWAIKFSWLTVCFWIAVTAAGILAFSSLKYALFPDITFPVVVVNAQAPLTSALDTETKLTKPLEESLKSLAGIENIRSSTYPGQSAVSLLFAVGTDLEKSTNKTTSALKELKLPEGAKYKIIPLNLNESSVISYAIESQSGNLGDLQKLADEKILPAIAQLPGVLKVSLLGAPPKSPPLNPSNATAALTQGGANLVRFNGQDVLAFQVIKRGDANTLEVVSRVEQEVQNLRSTLKDVNLTLAATQAEYIRQATKSTIDALIEAIILAIVVIFPFLWNWRATLISALAIPTSLLATFIVMAIFGFNLETITLLALALVIGSVIDDAIIDVENILRHIEEGQSPREAAHLATDEIGLTVVATTATAVAVFLPIGLMGGVVGQFFEPFGITVSASYIASTLVARTLSPVLSIYWLKPPATTSQRKENKIGVYFTEAYRNLLSWSLNHRKIVIALAVLSFIAGIALVPFIPKGFIPKLDRGEFNITYTAPLPKIPDLAALQLEGRREINSQSPVPSPQSLLPIPNPLNDSLEVAKKLEAEVRKFPDVETVFTTVGSRGGEPNKGTLYVKLKEDRTIKTAELQDQLRQNLPTLPGVTTSVEDIQFVDTGGEKPLQIALRGNDLKALNQAAKSIKDRITKIPGFADVTVTGDTNNADQVFQIERLNQERVAYISANLGQGLTLGDATDKIVAEAKGVLPADITLGLGGDSARQNEVFGSFISTLILSALCIIVVLILLFKSWVDPLVIGVSLPLAVVGAMLALLFTKSDFGMISLIGFVFLLGLANKNAIVLVDYINQLRRAGLERTEAILKAGPVRLRPIMMTTVSTLLGMLPIALGFGAGSELRSPMAVAIAGGLVTSTILSLIVVPVVYAILDDWFPRKNMTQ
ncbi:efflux RND transporter permease subunit [Anabaena cylindrica FACHB-243]|uniref:Acriflavin resistance protein n=1 Tax=Anabaena cylindrica (strain ATCC 27899 / PCC 7122) TaxID=272123 RepID=K9ZBP2_ANACC|nr:MULTISPECIES: efflux RND transporter permease subunit [Anabaena]AFZ55775.1 acriflavin resistance protein [Anabaena cylindrica PCC 7122]MBD2420224.1 efflux RND transporter permease subunit [Anabaena cylindrica FACHB-243]MBY5283095.1 efflux RND transporter permease subunit [Anabaena sp. CCAP 1446/1C]MBY5307812.1 efflux RND transporter permease subunit [Anabaena sp. CCAP 1446/1C]MCM2406124.1 efflux RND transporter permease subunit [Anabaena sp. CCAP 1446/1C]